jgi:hypothetical protein
MPDGPVIVCTNEDDGSFAFNDEQVTYTSRDVWDNGSITYHWADGGQFTTTSPSDASLIEYIIRHLCWSQYLGDGF